ncbi:MAG: NAD(P)/FAD-dependent oxidoreductase [Deltaproteobacteria bacterium]|nr:NAD(P)/FAD-dependent oxidoreductase [Nannocystaceae bacterium]
MPYDVVIVGGGPAGLSAALALGRARKRVLLCDSGPRRNAAAERIHNFVTRDGTPPEEFRQIARQQLSHYPNVEMRGAGIESVTGTRGAFTLRSATDVLEARRIILCTGMIDEPLPIDGFRELWGHAVFQCPYCHGWEVRERPWGYVARAAAALPFAVLLRSWSPHVTVFTNGAFDVLSDIRAQVEQAGVRLETSPIARLRRRERALDGVELADGSVVACEALFAHPPQRHVELVASLGLSLDGEGFVRVDPMSCETSMRGVYAAGDLTTRAQGAILAAAIGTQAAGMLNHELTQDLAVSGLL